MSFLSRKEGYHPSSLRVIAAIKSGVAFLQARFLVVFTKSIDAVRFTQVSQLKLVLCKWPAETSKFFGEEVFTHSRPPIPLFNGPRIAMAIHTTDAFVINGASGTLPNGIVSVQITGVGITFVCDLVEFCDGGQVVLTEKTWQRTQHSLPGRRKIINLGRHIVSASNVTPMLLIEMTPYMLSSRQFKPFAALEQTEMGYHDAPSINRPFAVAFVAVNKPRQVVMAERECGSDQSQAALDAKPEALIVYEQALELYADLLRRSLKMFRGYESKQLSPGRFFIVFSGFKDAILWACYFQSEMLELPWPEKLLKMDECSTQHCPLTQRVLRRGLGLRVGMAYGRAAFKAPTKTGQADYYGVVTNLASRVLYIAAPGQILIQPGDGFSDLPVRWIKLDKFSGEEVGILIFPERKDGVSMQELAVEIVHVGSFLAKGITELTTVYQVVGHFIERRMLDHHLTVLFRHKYHL